MGLDYAAILDANFLNDMEKQLGSFNPDFLERAISLCFPALPDEYFSDPQHQADLTAYLKEFFCMV